MKRLYIVLTILLSSFLLLSGREVKADTININYTDLDFTDVSSDDFNSSMDYINSFAGNYNTSTYYIFDYYINKYYFHYFSSSFNYSSIPCISQYGSQIFCSLDFSHEAKFSRSLPISGSSNLTNFSSIGVFFTSPGYLLFSNLDFVYSGVDDINFQYNGETKYSCPGDNSSCILPNKYDFYHRYVLQDVEPEPVDNTPQLTTFYTFVLAKIAYFCNYMATNTLFLTMLVIIILIFIFELIFRRRL